MSVWDTYEQVRAPIARTKRDRWTEYTRRMYTRRMLESPSCHEVFIDGETQIVCIEHTAERDQKKIIALPGETIKHGGIVTFANNKWIVVEKDADNTIYDKGIMQQCNHILRWISRKDGKLKEKWCFVEDGTKYLIGEKSNQLMAIGDSRIAVTIEKDEDTVELARGLRFLIDDADSDFVSAYQITKSNKLYNVFNNEGVFRFILNEVQLTADDNTDLRIADYNNWHPKMATDSDHVDSEYTVAQIVSAAMEEATEEPDDSKEGWL